jgi:hypothetical protein
MQGCVQRELRVDVLMRGSRCPEKFTLQAGRDSINGAIIEYRRGVTPFNTRRIYGHYVPQVTSIVAAGWLGSVKPLYLSFQRSWNQMRGVSISLR